MKRFLAVLLLMTLLCVPTGMADKTTYTGEDGTMFYGMLQNGEPNGFIASSTPKGDRMTFGILTDAGWEGSLYTLELADDGSFARMLISNYTNGICTASLHCYEDGTLTLFTYENGEIVSSIVRTEEEAVAYTIRGGEACDPQPVDADSLTGALSSAGVTLYSRLYANRTIYSVKDDMGELYAAVQIYNDGSVVASRYFDGEALTYNAAENNCIIGIMQGAAWAPGAVKISEDGSRIVLE